MSKGRLEYNRISPSQGHILYLMTNNIYLAISLQKYIHTDLFALTIFYCYPHFINKAKKYNYLRII